MYYQNKQDKQIVLSAFKVTRANFTGEAFDNAPFEGDTGHDWLEQAMRDGVVSLVPSGETTYAVWGVRTPDGEVMLASPGDYIVQDVGAEAIHVCPGPIWELLTEFLPEAEAPAPLPTAEEVEQIVEDVQGQVAHARKRLEEIYQDLLYNRSTDYKGMVEEVKGFRKLLGEHYPSKYEVVPNVINERQSLAFDAMQHEWGDRVTHLLDNPEQAIATDWQVLFDELNNAIPESLERVVMSRLTLRLFGTVGYLLQHLPTGHYANNENLWREVILDARVAGGKFLDKAVELTANEGKAENDNVILHMPASMFPKGTVLIQDDQGNVHGTAHVGQEFQMEPAQETPQGGSAAGLQGVIDAREMAEELEVMLNDFCDEAYRMYEQLKTGSRFDWKAFYARGLEIANPEQVDPKLVFVQVMGVAEHLSHLDIATYSDVLVAQTKVGIVARQREDMHKALEYVNTARMWIFETASTEDKDWLDMQKKLTWSHVVLSIHEQVPDDFDKVSGAVDHMIGSYPLSQ